MLQVEREQKILQLLKEKGIAQLSEIQKELGVSRMTLWRDIGMTVFMVTHDISEAFKLGTRLIVFDKVRHDPQQPNAFGATITYDIPVADYQDVAPDEPADVGTIGTLLDKRSAQQ